MTADGLGAAAAGGPERPTRRSRARWMLADLHPGYFALVMATGIISTGARAFGHPVISTALLWIAAVAYVALCLAYAGRAVLCTAEFMEDSRTPGRAFAYFTFVAGSNVLGARLAAAGHPALTATLAVAGAVAWIGLSYGVPAGLMLGTRRDVVEGINGTWFIWVVGTQSLAIAAAVLSIAYPGAAATLGSLAVTLWAFGAVLYVVIVTLVTLRLLSGPTAPEALGPAYWVAMGATAITVLAAAEVLSLPADLPVLAATVEVVRGTAFLLWAFGTWWIPMLLIFGAWRHGLRRVPLVYDPTLWSMVFPLGMYAAASAAFGAVARVPFLESIGRGEFWVALAVWAATFLGMLGSLGRDLRRSRPVAA